MYSSHIQEVVCDTYYPMLVGLFSLVQITLGITFVNLCAIVNSTERKTLFRFKITEISRNLLGNKCSYVAWFDRLIFAVLERSWSQLHMRQACAYLSLFGIRYPFETVFSDQFFIQWRLPFCTRLYDCHLRQSDCESLYHFSLKT